jgi:fatty aldehyde decarbonylase
MAERETLMLSSEHARYLPLHRVIVSQAVTGEMVGIENYARMIPLTRTVRDRLALLEDAWHERHHIEAMQEVASRLGIEIVIALADAYWSRVRSAFKERVEAEDLLACTIVQDIVLETYAVTLYEAIGAGVEPFIAERIAAIVRDEKLHLARGREALRASHAEAPERTVAAVEFANERVARVLCEWVQPTDCEPICGVCGQLGGRCAKEDLGLIDVNMAQVQARFAALYGGTLREAGLPVSAVTRWLARLAP